MKRVLELILPSAFVLGCLLLALNNPLGLGPLAFSMGLFGLESYYTRVKSDHSLALDALQKRMEAYENQLATTAKAQAQNTQDLISLRNATRPVGGWKNGY